MPASRAPATHGSLSSRSTASLGETPSREHASGSAGLGLAIAREIATAHGVTIELADAEGGGLRAIVTFARV